MFDNKNFFPSPQHIIRKMTDHIDFRRIRTVLEPSAGKGDVALFVADKIKYAQSLYKQEIKDFDIDTVELDENLQHILRGKNFRVIHDDFLTLETYKEYDLIIMNPPFDQGEKHLLKAISMQKNGGQIVCLLNAETINNPYSVTRQDLLTKLEDLNAKIDFIDDAFIDAERKTNVQIALIKIDIKKNAQDSILIDHLKQEEQSHYENSSRNTNDIVNGDFVRGIVQQYNIEAKAGIKLIGEFESMKPLMLSSFKEGYGCSSILTLSISDSNRYSEKSGNSLKNDYIQKLRMKYWYALFTSEQFTNLLTSNLREQYMNKVNELKNFDFSYYNIKQIQLDMNKSLIKNVEQTILDLFEEFSHKHSWYAETSRNIHYYNGWKTNQSWKINKKIIIPLKGYRDIGYSWESYDPTQWDTLKKIEDIEKVLNYLDCGLTKEVKAKEVLEFAKYYDETKDIELKYFNLTFYKKGTCHITFTNEDVLKKFNIFGSQQLNWLPPSYGKAKYSDMTKEEQTIIDEFEGKESYNEVIINKGYYIYNPETILMLADNQKTA